MKVMHTLQVCSFAGWGSLGAWENKPSFDGKMLGICKGKVHRSLT